MLRTTYDENLKLWFGANLTPLYNPKISIGEILLRSLMSNGCNIAQISDDSGIKMTFNDIRIKAIRAALNLKRLGYKTNNIFGFIARNSANVASIVFASLFNGCPLNTLDPNFGKIDLIDLLNITKPCLMFCDLNLYDLVAECLKELELKSCIFTFDGQTGDSKSVDSLFTEIGSENHFLPVKVDGENDIAFIVCSSGTTGPPKAVCVSHASLAFNIGDSFVNHQQIMLCFSPLHWITGILILLYGTVKGAKRIITTENFSPELLFHLIDDYKVTFLLNAPFHIALALKSDQLKTANLSSVTYQIVVGSKMVIEWAEQWSKYLKDDTHILSSYAFSELGNGISVGWVQENGKCGNVGQLANGITVKIIDDNGKRCGPNVDGEICVKHLIKSIGYFGNEKATRDLIDAEGFLYSGDIGHFDDDGYLYLIDRKKDLLKYQNYQLIPSEIEDFLLQRPEIDSVCVVGIPDGIDSELPAAIVIRNKNSYITADDISKLIAEHFADYYKLRGGIYFVETFPTSSSGKLLKRNLQLSAIEWFKNRKSP